MNSPEGENLNVWKTPYSCVLTKPRRGQRPSHIYGMSKCGPAISLVRATSRARASVIATICGLKSVMSTSTEDLPGTTYPGKSSLILVKFAQRVLDFSEFKRRPPRGPVAIDIIPVAA